MHSLGNNPNYPKMKNQLNAREDDQEKGAYQSNLQKELGLTENPDPSQPVLILEKTNKDILKPRTANVTSMKAKSAKDSELENEIMEQQFLKEYNHPFGRENLVIEPNLDEGNTRKTVNESSANNEDRVPKGLKNITALQTKSNRFDSSYNDKKITSEINKEYGVDLEDNPEEGGRLLILGPPRNPMKDVTGKNQNISSMKKQGSIHYYHEKEVLDEEFYENQEETKLFQDDPFNRKKGMKSPSRPNTASRIPTNHEQQIMKELDEELQDEVMIDQMKLTSSINNNNFLRTSQPRPTSMQNKAPSNRNDDKAKEEIIVAAMANQNSEKELRKSLSKNQNQLSQGELIFEKPPTNKPKTISNPTGFKTTTDRIESVTEKQIKQELLRNSTEELILQPRPLDINNIKNKNSSLASKETRIPNTREKQFSEKLDKEFQEELILDNNNPSTLRKSSSNASPMKNSATKIKTPSEMNAERQFQKTIDESVSPNTMKRQLSSKKGTADSSVSNNNTKKKETNSSTSLKTKNTATSRNPPTNSVPQRKMSGKEKASSVKEKEEFKIETPVLNAPRISERTPLQKESFQLNKLEDRLKELNLE
jgi:hypothetical protein